MNAPVTTARTAWPSAAILLALSRLHGAQADAPHAEDSHPRLVPVHVHRSGEQHGAQGVAVRVLDSADSLWLPEVAPWELFARVERHFPATVTDENGTAWIPEPNGSFLVLARSEGWIGFGQNMNLPESAFEVELVPDPTLCVRVVDASGKPVAGVSAALIGLDAHETRTLLESEASDEDGLAELHPGLWRGNDRVERICIMTANGDPRVELREVVRDAAPGQPVTLALGPTGVIEVVLVDGEGRPVEADARAWFDVPDTPPLQRLGGMNMLLAVPLQRGRGRFEHAPVGIELAFQVGGGGVIANESKGVQFEPRIVRTRLESAGQRLELPFAVSGVVARVHARLLQAPGEPLADTQVFVRWLECLVASERVDREYVDADGNVSSYAFSGSETAGEAQIEFSSFDPRYGLRSARATFALSGPVYHDLGEVLLTPAPLLASGRVVDERGEPLARAVVRAYELPKDGPPRWPRERSRRDLFAITGLDGRFDLRGTLDGGELLLEADHGRAQTGAKVAVELGSAEVRLSLPRTGAIEARAQLDEGRGAELYFVALAAGGQPAGNPSMRSGTYRIDRLVPGEYTLRCLWSENLLAEIPHVVVRPGETTRDPRCNPLDLRGKIP